MMLNLYSHFLCPFFQVHDGDDLLCPVTGVSDGPAANNHVQVGGEEELQVDVRRSLLPAHPHRHTGHLGWTYL